MTQETTRICKAFALQDMQLFRLGSIEFTSVEADRPILSAHYMIHYVAAGTGNVRIGNNTHSIQQGSVFIAFPNQTRQLLPAAGDPLTLHWIEVDGASVLPSLTQLGLAANKPMLSLKTKPEDCKTAEFFAQLIDDDTLNGEHQLGLCWRIFGSLSEEAAERNVSRSVNQRKQYVTQAIELIQCSYMQDITVEDIAEYCRVNRSYLGKLFRDETGKSTQEYLIEYRMEVACRYLRETTAPIGTIALSVGYQNQLHFSRAFRKTYGMSPRDWQKEQRMMQHM